MGSYIGTHAALYDVFYDEKDYFEEAQFISDLLGAESKGFNLIELACGTGTHSFFLEKNGFNVTGIDYSKDMIQQSLKKKKQRKSKNEFFVENMMELSFKDSSFDNAICLFDSIGYLQTNEAILKALKEIYRVLVKGGKFIFEFWHAGAMIKNYDPVRVKYFKTKEGDDITRISETDIDLSSQTCSVNYSIYIHNDKGFNKISENQTNRFFLCQEIKLFLATVGFKQIQFYDGFTKSQKLDDNSWHIVCVTNK